MRIFLSLLCGQLDPPAARRGLNGTSLLLLASVLAGCNAGPNYKAPHVEVKPGFGELSAYSKEAATQPSKTVAAQPVTAWWTTFHDPELNHLVQVALMENYDLRIATMRILESRAQRKITVADLFPEVDADGGYEHGRGSKNVALNLGGSGGGSGGGGSSSGGSGGSSGSSAKSERSMAASSSSGGRDQGSSPFSNTLNPLGQGGLPGVTSDLYQIGFDATWELDVFGANRRQLEAATADLQAAVEARRDTMVTLLAEVARSYLELRGAQKRLSVAQRNLKAGQEILELTHSIQSSGLTTDLDVARSAGQVATTAATIPPLEGQVRRSMHAIAILLGKEPNELRGELSEEKALPGLPPEVPVGLPSDLLLRRPDIRRAERMIAAANARVGAATADLFPKFGLTGSVGLDATQFKNLFDWESRYFLISPTVTWPIFDAGRIVSNISLQKNTTEEMRLQYRKAVLTALQDVEDSLVNYATEQARHKALEQVLKQSTDALNISREQYKNGLTTFINVLDAERSNFDAQDQLATSEQMMTTNLVAVYKALGGGWQVEAGDKQADARVAVTEERPEGATTRE